jgi:hypothetical protein
MFQMAMVRLIAGTGAFMERVLGELLPKMHVPGRSVEELSTLLRAGDLSFMFDDNGKFIHRA